MTKFKSTPYLLSVLPLIWLHSLLFAYDSDKHYATLCIICFIVIVTLQKGRINLLHKITNSAFLSILCLTIVSAIISKVTVGYGTSVLRIYIVSLLAILIITPKSVDFFKRNIHFLLPISSLISLAFILYYSTYLNVPRSNWPINAIPYTTMVSTIAVLSLQLSYKTNQHKEKLIYIASYLLCFCGVIISDTRTGILAILLLSTFIIISESYKRKNILKTFLTVLLLGSVIISINHKSIEQRYQRTKAEVEKISDGNMQTSIGLRLEMWYAGYQLAKNPTIFGIGDAHIEEKKKLFELGEISKKIIGYTHYHNEFISSFVKRGVLGFICFLGLLFYPIYSYIRQASDFRKLGVVTSLTYFTYSLTDVPLYQASPAALYIILIYLFDREENFNNNKAIA